MQSGVLSGGTACLKLIGLNACLNMNDIPANADGRAGLGARIKGGEGSQEHIR